MPRGRVAVFGDVGGQHDELCSALIDLGMDPDSNQLPDDLTVVQIGDLIHRGPDTARTLRLVRRILQRHPDRWVQLAGNHEALYLPHGPAFQWPETLSDDAVTLLRDWWRDGTMKVAVGLQTDVGDLLLTHAGLTSSLWRKLGCRTNVREVAAQLNALPHTNPPALFETGRMMNGGTPNWNAGPLWAEAGSELYPSWLAVAREGVPVPFGQVHGHSSAMFWRDRQWRGHFAARPYFIPKYRQRHLVGVIDGQFFAGIDPDFGKFAPQFTWAPLVFENARVVAR